MKNAVVLGSKGQDGRLLSALLESRGYRVTGVDARPEELDITSEPQVIGFLREAKYTTSRPFITLPRRPPTARPARLRRLAR